MRHVDTYDECYLIGNFDQQTGYPLRSIVVVRHVINHLDNVDDPHQRLFHLGWILQIDGMTGLLDGSEKLGVVGSLHVIFCYATINVIPNL